jgi:hypothetical protein
MLADLLPKASVPAGYQRRFHQVVTQRSGALGCGRTGVVPTRMVGEQYLAGTGAEIDEVLRGYPSVAVAQRAMQQIVAFTKACHHSGSYTLRRLPYPRLGQRSQAQTVVNTLTGIGVVSRAQWVYVLSGTTIVLVSITSPDKAVAPSSRPLVRAAVARLGG